jgi:hypothetical protein
VRDGESTWVYRGNGNSEPLSERDLQGEVDLINKYPIAYFISYV